MQKQNVKNVRNVRNIRNIRNVRNVRNVRNIKPTAEVCVKVKLSPGIKSRDFSSVCKGLAGMSCEGFSYLKERLEANVF
jgi:hypothetical protein